MPCSMTMMNGQSMEEEKLSEELTQSAADVEADLEGLRYMISKVH